MSAQPPSISDAIGPPRGGLPRWLMPAVFGVVVLAGVLAVIVLAARSGGSDAPPQPPPFAPPAPSRVVTAYDVREVTGDVLTLAVAGSTADRPSPVTLRSDVAVEVLAPATASDVEPGDWVTIIGIPNEVRNYSITAIVVVPPPHGEPIDAFRTTASGFLGHEPIRDTAQVPILGGEVTAVDGDTLTLTGPDGTMLITLTEAAPLVRVARAAAGAIGEGDRIAVLGTSAADASAVLVLPKGAALVIPDEPGDGGPPAPGDQPAE
ncbi:MAG: hypothetical protein Kow0010_13500 [Dehalococcoidia bacterium]